MDKVEIHSAEGTVIAEDCSGQSYEYQSEFLKPESKETSAVTDLAEKLD